HFSARAAGQPLKNVKLALGGEKVAGEVMITETGIEGGAVYAVSAVLRDALESAGRPVTLMLDLKPQMAEAEVTERLAARRKGRSLSAFLSGELKLAPVAYALLREVRDPLPDRPEAVAALIKHVPLPVERPRPIEEAISSAGGIRFDAADDRLMLKAIPRVFVCGEMLDWEAPTGGYLLQGCMSTAVAAAEGVMQWLGVAG
ncbi:MAG TPA: NAD(P)/FAD-dependent oxidoreductase, partial [Candidatus Binatia bacterium]|nr:NAD(P)/FAD-dependent oxidoreductase [Candidatus Binatia bacterium]